MIKIKNPTLISERFREKFALLMSKDLPISTFKILRRMGKAIQDEVNELIEDTKTIQKNVFGEEFPEADLKKLITISPEKLNSAFDELKYSEEKRNLYLSMYKQVDEKCDQLMKGELELKDFEKITLPEFILDAKGNRVPFFFPASAATVLEDILNLD